MNSNQLPLSGGIAVFFAVIIGYFVIDPSALDGFRPGGDGSQIEQVHGIEDVQARLWQDPFAAAAMHKNSHKTQSAKIQLAGKLVLPPLGNEHSTSLELTLGSTGFKDKKMSLRKHDTRLRNCRLKYVKKPQNRRGGKTKRV